MALLAADGSIRCFRAGRLGDCPGVGNVAQQAPADVVRRQRLAQVFGRLDRVDGMPGSDIPERRRLVAIMGEPKLPRLTIVVAAHEGQPAVS